MKKSVRGRGVSPAKARLSDVFFFSSRRRHTRFDCDWSSDVCSSDLVPVAYADHARLMFDLQVLALQGDVTRIITFQLARETSNRTYPEIGVPDPHHQIGRASCRERV